MWIDDLAAMAPYIPRDPDGYAERRVDAVIDITSAGELYNITSLGPRGKRMRIPEPPARTSSIAPAFLSGFAPYWLGTLRATTLAGAWANRGTKYRAEMRDLHERLLLDSSHPALRAVLDFLRREPPDVAIPDGNIITRVDGVYPHEVDEAKQRWRSVKMQTDTNPRVRLGRHALLRLWSPRTVAAYGHQDQTDRIPIADAARALGWLTQQLNTIMINDDVALVSWVHGRADLNPSSYLYPSMGVSAPVPDWPHTVHVALLAVKAPSRISCRYYWRGDGPALSARLRRAYQRYDDFIAEHRRHWHSQHIPPWPAGFRARDPIAWQEAVIRFLVGGRPLPRGVLSMLMHAPRAHQRSSGGIGLASLWATFDDDYRQRSIS